MAIISTSYVVQGHILRGTIDANFSDMKFEDNIKSSGLVNGLKGMAGLV